GLQHCGRAAFAQARSTEARHVGACASAPARGPRPRVGADDRLAGMPPRRPAPAWL
ncbi:MAG: hypothetical protein AVDCRST_MAG65-226, partial [uncultured Solirubrobacteraceae bacterium]